MTTEELRAMDVEIHRRVMGLECFERDGMWCQASPISRDFNGEPFVHQIPDYSPNIASAWQVVERICRQGVVTFLVSCDGLDTAYSRITVVSTGRVLGAGKATTAPEAICLAVLEATKEPK